MAVNNVVEKEECLSSMDEIFEGRRKYPRVDVGADNKMIVVSNGEQYETKLMNISLDGAQINCDKVTAKAILPHDPAVKEKRDLKVNTFFDLEIDGQNRKIQAQCKIYYVVSLDGSSISFGLLFEHLDDAHKAVIEQFVMLALEEYQ